MGNWTQKDINRLQSKGFKVKETNTKGIMPTVKASELEKKYGNIRCEYDNLKFQSRKECDRYKELRVLESAGKISGLKTQVKYLLITEKSLKYTLSYIADFVYLENGSLVVEDVKAFNKISGEYILSQKFKQKMRLMKNLYGLDIKLI